MKNTNYMILAALALVIGSFAVFASPAHAAPFTLLNGQNLSEGSTGQNVVELQGLLSELGYLNVPSGVPFGYFGPLTQGALTQYQSISGINPASGYFDATTQQYMQNSFTSKGWLSLLDTYSY